LFFSGLWVFTFELQNHLTASFDGLNSLKSKQHLLIWLVSDLLIGILSLKWLLIGSKNKSIDFILCIEAVCTFELSLGTVTASDVILLCSNPEPSSLMVFILSATDVFQSEEIAMKSLSSSESLFDIKLSLLAIDSLLWRTRVYSVTEISYSTALGTSIKS
jgi:hypothetical protein